MKHEAAREAPEGAGQAVIQGQLSMPGRKAARNGRGPHASGETHGAV